VNDYDFEDVSELKALISLLLIFTLAGCTWNESANPQHEEKPSDSSNDKPKPAEPTKPDGSPATPASPATPVSTPSQQENTLKKFFPDDNQVKYFEGEGNEFADEKEIIFELQDNYLPTIVSNGGTSMLKIYKMTDTGIYLVYQQPEYYENRIPDLSTLESQFKEVPILTEPLKPGTMINGWKVIALDQNLLLPIGTVKQAVILEKTDDNGSVSRQYWAPRYGLVKKEFYMKDSMGTETIITTELLDSVSRN
jgi:hypothetical protein